MTRLYVPSPLYHNDPFHTASTPLSFIEKLIATFRKEKLSMFSLGSD